MKGNHFEVLTLKCTHSMNRMFAQAPKGPEKVEMLGYSSAEDIEKAGLWTCGDLGAIGATQAGAIAAGVVFARELVLAPQIFDRHGVMSGHGLVIFLK